MKQNLPQRLGVQIEAFRQMFDAFDFALRVASPGIVQAFNPTKQTVTVKLALKEKIRIDGVLKIVEIPILQDVPIVVPRAGGWAVTFPIKAGDECLVVFGDTCIDSWWQNGGVQEPMSLRRHDLSDAFAIMGTWSQKRLLPDYSADSTQIRNDAGTQYIDLSEEGISIVDTLKISLSAPQIEIVGETSVSVEGGAVDISGSTVGIEGETTVDVSGESINIEGEAGVNISGNLNTVIEEKDFLTHTHGGVTGGTGTTGGVI